MVKGQKTSYGDAADLKKRGVADSEIIEGISKLNIDELTKRILESEVTLVF